MFSDGREERGHFVLYSCLDYHLPRLASFEHLKLSQLKTGDYRRLEVFDMLAISYELIPRISVYYK